MKDMFVTTEDFAKGSSGLDFDKQESKCVLLVRSCVLRFCDCDPFY